MKEYLVSWYGITDFKASLHIEKSGPLLGALQANDYTDIQLLGYTNDGKQYTQEDFDTELQALNRDNRDEANNFLYKWANTPQAHTHFIAWLQDKAAAYSKNTSIGFTPVRLKKLNDTEGIYAAAMQVLSTLTDNSNGEDVYATLFLSPGTPVMAFCWAMAALKFPQLKKRLIASPDPRHAPEVIGLPQEWMEWYGKQLPLENRNGKYFDAIFHLCGEQRIPAYLGVKQFRCKKHIFVTSENYHAVEVMKQFVNDDVALSELKVPPFNPKEVRKKLSDFIEAQDDFKNRKIGFNLTGGTKLMYAGALNVCRQQGGIPFYFNTHDKQVVFLNDFSVKPIVKIETIETFIKLNSNGLSITDCGRKYADQPEMISLTDLLWKKRNVMNEVIKKLNNWHFNLQYPLKKYGLSFFCDKGDRTAFIETDDMRYEFESKQEFKVYVNGGWFEEYIYNNLYELYKTKRLTDVRHSVKISYGIYDKNALKQFLDLHTADNNQLYQELDVACTDGNRLYIVECKTGKAEAEHVMKLENIVRYYGGVEGKGILVYSQKVDNPVALKKAEESNNVRIFDGDDIISHIKELLDFYD